MTEQDLLDAGFYKIPIPYGRNADHAYQKRVTDGDGTRFFIECYQYIFGDITSFTYKCYLYLDDNHHLTMTTGGRFIPGKAEAVFTATWKALNCQQYERTDL